ncbi:hypothetical protein EYF80_041808 [Liparis tanakae]|uniref:Uncharacterized protein n=1 Tax=Liparis tanakae TaxID=230148 RepID=A0A4Z2G4H8_9TELE|nr:hypothetical protein EYF80_041808 [Liparis tanakae]
MGGTGRSYRLERGADKLRATENDASGVPFQRWGYPPPSPPVFVCGFSEHHQRILGQKVLFNPVNRQEVRNQTVWEPELEVLWRVAACRACRSHLQK